MVHFDSSVDSQDWLWHYTSMDTFYIWMEKDPTLYATHYKLLNDSDEAFYRRDFLEQLNNDELLRAYATLLEKFSEEEDLFITSFSHIGDGAHQWQAYAKGGGLAVAFDMKELAAIFFDMHSKIDNFNYEILANRGVCKHLSDLGVLETAQVLQECRYVDKKIRIQSSKQLFDQLKKNSNDPLLKIYLQDELRRRSCIFKNTTFEYEQEFRISVYPCSFFAGSGFAEEEALYNSIKRIRQSVKNVGGKLRIATRVKDLRPLIKAVRISPHGRVNDNSLMVDVYRDKYALDFLIKRSESSYNGK